MKLRCKFRIGTVTESDNGFTLKLYAWNQKDGDNTDWSKWTPSGSFEVMITNPDVKREDFKPGQFYYIDLEKLDT